MTKKYRPRHAAPSRSGRIAGRVAIGALGAPLAMFAAAGPAGAAPLVDDNGDSSVGDTAPSAFGLPDLGAALDGLLGTAELPGLPDQATVQGLLSQLSGSAELPTKLSPASFDRFDAQDVQRWHHDDSDDADWSDSDDDDDADWSDSDDDDDDWSDSDDDDDADWSDSDDDDDDWSDSDSDDDGDDDDSSASSSARSDDDGGSGSGGSSSSSDDASGSSSNADNASSSSGGSGGGVLGGLLSPLF